jgi:hypothetical protein
MSCGSRGRCMVHLQHTSSFPPGHDANFLLSHSKDWRINKSCCTVANQKPFYRHTPNSAKSTKSTIRVRLTSKMWLKMLLSFCTFESTKPGNKSTLFPGLISGFWILKVLNDNKVQNKSGQDAPPKGKTTISWLRFYFVVDQVVAGSTVLETDRIEKGGPPILQHRTEHYYR